MDIRSHTDGRIDLCIEKLNSHEYAQFKAIMRFVEKRMANIWALNQRMAAFFDEWRRCRSIIIP